MKHNGMTYLAGHLVAGHNVENVGCDVVVAAGGVVVLEHGGGGGGGVAGAEEGQEFGHPVPPGHPHRGVGGERRPATLIEFDLGNYDKIIQTLHIFFKASSLPEEL